MKKNVTYPMALALCAMMAPALNASGEGVDHALTNVRAGITRSGQQAGVDMTVMLDSMEIKKNQRLILRPLLCGARDTLQLTPLVINGRNAAITYQRNGEEAVDGAQVVDIRQEEREVSYQARFPYEDWMNHAQVYVVNDACGCGLTKAGSLDDATALATLKKATPRVVEKTAPAQEEEVTNVRSISGSAMVHFPVNKTVILPTHYRNQEEIDKILHTIEQVKGDPDFRIDHVTIHGYASPEGSYENNARLAEGRSQALVRYVAAQSGVPLERFTAESTPEDWDGLIRFLNEQPTEHAAGILQIIASESDPDRRNDLIRQRYPQDYAQLLENVYPLLRHSDYTVTYSVLHRTTQTVTPQTTVKETVWDDPDADVLDD